jgi:hypothetical protein
MKKLIFIFVVAVFVITACKKENTGEMKTPPMNSSQKTEALILAFKDKLDNNLKDGTTYMADSAVWYVEGLLNYEQANNAHNFYGLEFYYDSVLLNASNGEIPIQELNDAYAYFNDVIASILEQANDPLLNIDLVDVSLVETGLKDGSVEMELVVSTGKGTSINYTLFPDSADWYWGNDLGACGDNTSNEIADATDKLEYKYNHPIAPGQGGWFTGVVSVEVNYYGYEDLSSPGNPGPYCDAMIFYWDPGVYGVDDPCIEHEELNYYLSKFDYIKADNQPTGKTFKSVDVWWSQVYNYYDSFYHFYTLYYGVLSESPD